MMQNRRTLLSVSELFHELLNGKGSVRKLLLRPVRGLNGERLGAMARLGLCSGQAAEQVQVV